MYWVYVVPAGRVNCSSIGVSICRPWPGGTSTFTTFVNEYDWPASIVIVCGPPVTFMFQ